VALADATTSGGPVSCQQDSDCPQDFEQSACSEFECSYQNICVPKDSNAECNCDDVCDINENDMTCPKDCGLSSIHSSLSLQYSILKLQQTETFLRWKLATSKIQILQFEINTGIIGTVPPVYFQFGEKNTHVFVYTRKGSYLGKETKERDWDLVQKLVLFGNGDNTPTPLPPLSNPIELEPGERQSFYITIPYFLQSTGGASEGAEYMSDSNLKIFEGAAMVGMFPTFPTFYRPQVWNGNIHYLVVPDTVTVTGGTPVSEPSSKPSKSLSPSAEPSFEPSLTPSDEPSRDPSGTPVEQPSIMPSLSLAPSEDPSVHPLPSPTSGEPCGYTIKDDCDDDDTCKWDKKKDLCKEDGMMMRRRRG